MLAALGAAVFLAQSAVAGGVIVGQVGFGFDNSATNPYAIESVQKRFANQFTPYDFGRRFVE